MSKRKPSFHGTRPTTSDPVGSIDPFSSMVGTRSDMGKPDEFRMELAISSPTSDRDVHRGTGNAVTPLDEGQPVAPGTMVVQDAPLVPTLLLAASAEDVDDENPKYAATWPALVDKLVISGRAALSPFIVLWIVWAVWVAWLFIQDNSRGTLDSRAAFWQFLLKSGFATAVCLLLHIPFILCRRDLGRVAKVVWIFLAAGCAAVLVVFGVCQSPEKPEPARRDEVKPLEPPAVVKPKCQSESEATP